MTPESLTATYECCGYHFIISLNFRDRKRTTFVKTPTKDATIFNDLHFCPVCGKKLPDLKVNGKASVPLTIQEDVRNEDEDLKKTPLSPTDPPKRDPWDVHNWNPQL
jgi:hypothetical protein